MRPSPSNGPQLTRGRQNQYIVTLPVELEDYDSPSIVFRIETENGDIYYQWMIEVETNFITATLFNDVKLDLASYTGQRLNIAYAYVNPNSELTHYSESTQVVVPGTVLYHSILCIYNVWQISYNFQLNVL